MSVFFEAGKKYQNVNNGLVYSCEKVHENGSPYLSRNAHRVGTLGFSLDPENFTKFQEYKEDRYGEAS